MLTASALAGLALAAFLAATPIPFQSEIIFAGLLAAWPDHLWSIVIVASVANTAGSCVTYAAGRGLSLLQRWPRLHIPRTAMAKAETWFSRWGVWTLLFSWAPGGDLACAVAGALRTPLALFVLLVGIAKTVRYLVVAAITLGLFGA